MVGVFNGGPQFQAVLRVAQRGRCKTVVVENRYIDADYRSDFSSFWSKRFDVPSPFATRVHFFRSDIRDDQLAELPKRVRDGYLGYSVLRPLTQSVGRVGRTVLAPPPALRHATLAAIEDEVNLFGNKLQVSGVPFMEQDGEYLRCAHAAIWGCHYSAAKRGLVGRRLTADLVDMTPDVLTADRALPSRGMILEQIQAVFAATGQPALRYVVGALPTVLGVEEPIPKLDSANRPLLPGFWDTRLFSVVCRYLNAGFPVMAVNASHGWNLVGWFREEGKIKFVASDDNIGPYEVIDSPFEDARRAPWRALMVPLPPKVYMSAEMAENWAHQLIRSFGKSQGAPPEWVKLANDLAVTPKKEISLRTFLREANDYKEALPSQGRPAPVVDALRLGPLPRFVWVIEAHDRKRRDSGDAAVLAEVVLDPHSSDRERQFPRIDSISLPGFTMITPPGPPAPSSLAHQQHFWRSQIT